MPRSPLLDLAAAVYIADTVSRWDGDPVRVAARLLKAAAWTLATILGALGALFLVGAVTEQSGALLACAALLSAPMGIALLARRYRHRTIK